MAMTDPVDIMLAHDAWATRKVLGACGKISKEQFHRPFDMGLGSLHMNLTHVLSAMRRWTDRLAGRTPRAMLHALPGQPQVSGEAVDRTPAELIALLDEAERDLREVAARSRQDGFAGTVSMEFAGKDGAKKRYTFTHGAVLAHVCTHGMHHRAQCLNMLKQLGVKGVSDGLPESSVTDWSAEVERVPEVLG